MVNENKILTVSYGTFSCTLEGFDDPFSTMKAIAEYFRDLAAGDRFFGAEPPQPDTEMLHRIAEQTIQQRVSVTSNDDNSVVLRQTRSPEELPPPAMPMTLDLPDAKAPEKQAVLRDPRPENENSVAAKLARIRASVDGGQSDTPDAKLSYSEDEHAGDQTAAQSALRDNIFMDGGVQTAPWDAESIEHGELTVETDPVAEEPADKKSDEPSIVVERISQEDLSDPAEEDALDAERPEKLSADEESDLQRLLEDAEGPAIDGNEGVEATLEEQGEAEDDLPSVSDSEGTSIFSDTDDVAELVDVPENSAPDVEPIDDLPTLEEDAITGEPEKAVEPDAPLAAEEAEDDPEEDHEVENVRASRLLRRKALTAADEDVAVERLMDVTSSRLGESDSSVRRASIAHLKAAVAATKADASIVDEAAQKEEREISQYRDDLARVVRPGRPDVEGGQKTDRPEPLMLLNELRIDEEEAKRRGPFDAEGKPRRLTRSELVMQEDAEDYAAMSHDKTYEKEQVRQIEDRPSFEDYVKEKDALEMPDLVEAAAAHFTFVEDTPEFTRPMLMRKAASISAGGNITREAGLRAFGSILREGRIVKGQEGRFTLSKKSRFYSG
ncbi:hypothetical protein [Litoreibacter roseus]|uniref:Lipoprotein n=1 Tax=Litoreibacter roseus TaxID=2601869 RepID=A0A6N6JI32_9RHOB|nr:hypothetical protein [Litoreibacter roseus]GFE65926.1 hypothetical protein KIN_30000 [Litoreibacter roseus]